MVLKISSLQKQRTVRIYMTMSVTSPATVASKSPGGPMRGEGHTTTVNRLAVLCLSSSHQSYQYSTISTIWSSF